MAKEDIIFTEKPGVIAFELEKRMEKDDVVLLEGRIAPGIMSAIV